MASYNNSTFGEISGRHGSAVATTTKHGKTFLRVFRQAVDAKTNKQVAQRTRFTFLAAFLSSMREIFKVTFKAQGGYNYGFAQAMKNAVTGSAPDFGIDFSKLTFTEGGMKPPRELTVVKSADNTLKVEWNISNLTENIIGGARPNELVSLVVYNEELQESMLLESACERSAGAAEVPCPDYWTGETVHCWIYVTRADGKLNSESAYIGSVVL